MSSRLERFREAQSSPNAGHEAALEEVRAGRKRGHWIWYVLPQLHGLGTSAMSETYGIDGRDEAVEYLRDPTLRDRYLELTAAIAEQLRRSPPASLCVLMGSDIDALKTVSSLTLFGRVADQLGAESKQCLEIAALAREVLGVADAQGYPPCRRTLRALGIAESSAG